MTGRSSRRNRAAGAAAALVVVTGAVAVGTGALPSSGPPASGPAAPTAAPVVPPPAEDGPVTRTPEDYGAVGDGEADDTAALQAALDGLRPGDTLELVQGRTYRHADVLRIGVPDSAVTGAGTLLASTEERSALMVQAAGVELAGVTLRISGTTKRFTGLEQHRLVLGRHAGIVVRGVSVEGSAGAGVYVEGSSDFRLEQLRVSDTRADGIHMTGGAHDGVVLQPVVMRSGDDGVAVVSYDADPETTRGITVQSPRVESTTWGRGVSVVGGEDVVYRDVHVQDSNAAAIYIATEGEPFFTRSTRGVRVLGAELLRANTSEQVDHGAVLVASQGQDRTISDVLIEQVSIQDTRAAASRQVGVLGEDGSVEGVTLRAVAVDGGGELFSATAGPDSYRLAEWVVDGQAVPDTGNA